MHHRIAGATEQFRRRKRPWGCRGRGAKDLRPLQTRRMQPTRSDRVESIFGLLAPQLGVVAFEISPTLVTLDGLHPDERAATAAMGPGRLRTFVAGRRAAAAALECLGHEPFPIGVGPRRQPLWPPGIVGSITHTDDRCIVVASNAYGAAGIGIDVEHRGRVTADVLGTILTASELVHHQRLTPSQAERFAGQCFGAKEALYKAQFPVTGAWLGFHDVHLGVGPPWQLHIDAESPVAGIVGPVAVAGFDESATHLVAAIVLTPNVRPSPGGPRS